MYQIILKSGLLILDINVLVFRERSKQSNSFLCGYSQVRILQGINIRDNFRGIL